MDRPQVAHIAHLARLAITPEEADAYAAQLSDILALVEQMNRVDTESTEPLAHPGDMTLRLREDEVTASDQRAAYQQLAPASAHGLYLTPKVID